jgi:hypothetical protein
MKLVLMLYTLTLQLQDNKSGKSFLRVYGTIFWQQINPFDTSKIGICKVVPDSNYDFAETEIGTEIFKMVPVFFIIKNWTLHLDIYYLFVIRDIKTSNFFPQSRQNFSPTLVSISKIRIFQKFAYLLTIG